MKKPSDLASRIFVRRMIKDQQYQSGSSGGGFTAGGDLSGTSTSQTVIGWETKPLDAATMGSPALNDVPKWDGAKWVAGAGGGGGVTAVTATEPVVSSGGTTPDISLGITLGLKLDTSTPKKLEADIGDGLTFSTNTIVANLGSGLQFDSSSPKKIETTVGLREGSIGVTIDGGGATPSTGFHGYIQVPYACTITSWTMLANVAGAAQITVKKCDYAGFPTTASIDGGNPPKINATNQKATDSTLAGWTTSITAGDILEFNLDSVATITWLILQLFVTKS